VSSRREDEARRPRRRRARHEAHRRDSDGSSEESSHRLAREASKLLEAPRLSPLQILARGALVVLLLYLIFGVLIPQFASYAEIWDAITSLTPLDLLLMVGLTLLIEFLKGLGPSLLIDRLTPTHAFLAQETAAVVSNTIPGPSGTISKYATYRRYGIDTVDFTRGTAMNGAWNNVIVLVLPTIAMILLSFQDDVPGRIWAVTLVALSISVVVIVVGAAVVRSERFARWFGQRSGRIVNWARGVVKRPPTEAVGQAVVRFRFDVLATAKDRGMRLTLILTAKEATTFLALLVSLRSLDVGRVDLTAVEVFASYCLVRLLTIIELTPGNVGIAETLYIATLTWAAPHTGESVIVAAVFVFRMFTYLGPIVIGGGCWVWLRRYFRRHPVPAHDGGYG
jgi:putative heme transporter